MPVHEFSGGRDPLVVLKEYVLKCEEEGREPVIDEIENTIRLLEVRLDKVRCIFPEYKTLSFGDSYEKLVAQLHEKNRAGLGRLARIRKAAGLL